MFNDLKNLTDVVGQNVADACEGVLIPTATADAEGDERDRDLDPEDMSDVASDIEARLVDCLHPNKVLEAACSGLCTGPGL